MKTMIYFKLPAGTVAHVARAPRLGGLYRPVIEGALAACGQPAQARGRYWAGRYKPRGVPVCRRCRP